MGYIWVKTLFQAITIILSLWIIVYFLFKGKKSPLMYSFIWCQSLILIWSVGQIFELLAIDRQNRWAFVIFEYLAICFIGLSWLMFALFYAEYQILVRKSKFLLLFVPPILFFLFVITNEYHNLFFSIFEYRYRVYGILFWMHVLISYTYILLGTCILIKCSVKKLGYAKNQSLLLIFASIVPLSLNAMHIFKIIDLGFDITPYSFFYSLMVFAVATFRYRFLNIMPVALRKIFDNMDEAIVVVDLCNKIIDFNKNFYKSFSEIVAIQNNDDISTLIGKLKHNIQNKEVDKILSNLKGDITSSVTEEINIPFNKCLSVKIRPVYDKGKIVGRVICFNDISEYKRLLYEVNQKNTELSALNDELTSMNEQLTEYANTVEELAIVKERNRLAREVHDTLGHTITLLITLMKVSRIACRKDPDEAEQKLSQGIIFAVDGLKELRRSISGLSSVKLERGSIITVLEELIENSKSTGTDIEFSVYGKERQGSTIYSDTLYRICQEAITNSLRHGNASHIDIMLKFIDNKIKLYIIDDGIGCKSVKKGFGLHGMEERVRNANGTMIYGSNGEKGFNIHVEIPIGVEN